ncbi:MAG: hypothetical protein Q8N00_13040 [Nitrospirota bacterium]|nr:hypothetical protein [Nitrospirota bacterium]MDP3598317.1 hypothetical protein [Nitrospirota bacterium]
MQPSNPYASFVDQITQKLADPDEATRLRQKRQALLTGLCTTLVDWYRPSEGVITPEMVAAAKVAILDELGALAIEALPQAELTLRGAAIRNRIFAPYVWRQQELVAHQNEQQQQDALRIQHEASIRARQLKRKAMLIELGITRALQSASSRGILHRALVVLEWEVRARLEAWLVGDETDSQVDETIEAAIDRPLLEWEARVEQYQSAQRQRIMDHCLTVALPVVEAAVPWVKAVVVRTICETLGMQSPPSSPRNEAGASSTNEAAPDNSDAPTPRQVRRRRVSPASPPMDRGEASATQTAPSASSEKWTASN